MKGFGFLIFCGIIATTFANVPECPKNFPNEENIMLPNPDDCTSYYTCRRGHPILVPCPHGLHFSPTIKICTLPHEAGCDRPPTEPPTKPTDPPTEPPTKPTDPPTEPPTKPTDPPTEPPTKPTDPPTEPPTKPTDPPTKPPTKPTDPPTKPPTKPTDPPTKPPTKPTDPPTEPPTKPTDPPTKPPTKPTDPPTKPPTKPTDPPTKPPTKPTDPPTKPTEPPATVTCPPQIDWDDNFLLPNPKDCGSFYQCAYGVPHLMKCPGHLHFNYKKKVCDYPIPGVCINS